MCVCMWAQEHVCLLCCISSPLYQRWCSVFVSKRSVGSKTRLCTPQVSCVKRLSRMSCTVERRIQIIFSCCGSSNWFLIFLNREGTVVSLWEACTHYYRWWLQIPWALLLMRLWEEIHIWGECEILFCFLMVTVSFRYIYIKILTCLKRFHYWYSATAYWVTRSQYS